MIPLLPLIGAAAGIYQGISNRESQVSQNAAQRDWEARMSRQQREWALEDWKMNNDYNHPSSQMARLRDAGLNPNLVYGNGATTTATPVRQSPSYASNLPAPQLDVRSATSSLMSYYDVQLKEAQVDNLRTANTVQMQDALLKSAQILAVGASTDATKASTNRARFDLELANTLKDTSIEVAKAGLGKTLADTKFTLDGNERAAALNSSSLKEAAERILNLRASRANTLTENQEIQQRVSNLNKEGQLKDFEIELRRSGARPGDPFWWSLLMRLIGPQVKEGMKGVFDADKPSTGDRWNWKK